MSTESTELKRASPALVLLPPSAWQRGRDPDTPAMRLAADIVEHKGPGYVGVDANRDINFVIRSVPASIELLAQGKIDALMGFPPVPQELREKKIGHVIVSSGLDRPWSQYFCCIVAAHQEFVGKNPVATKRALRALLKATHFCSAEPESAARLVAAKGYEYKYALQTMREIPYAKWREYDAEDTVRFYSLRLREAGMIKSAPNKIIAQGTDWRFYNELKRELKS